MDLELKQAILNMLSIESSAITKQQEKGVSDIGKRRAVTAGEHLDPLAIELSKRISALGIPSEDIRTTRSDLSLPGWYRRDKAWDLVAYSKDSLAAAIELKSITGSFGNNSNNRIEKALGSAEDIRLAKREGLLGNNTYPPFIGFVMIIYETEDSLKIVQNKALDKRVHPDSIFENANRIQRFSIALSRMIQEKFYDAAWLVTLNPVTKEVKEPLTELSFDHFWEILKAKINVIVK